MAKVIDSMLLTEFHDWGLALLGGLSAFADAILGVGLIVPGELVVTGLAVTVNRSQTLPLVVLVALGASLGDDMNYGLGRALGAQMAESRVVVAVGEWHWRRGVLFLDRYGPRAIVLTRLISVVRTLVPAIAGASALPYRRFLPASLIGSLLWSLTWILAGQVITRVLTEERLLAAALSVAVVVMGYLQRVRRHHRRRPRRAVPKGRGL